MAALDEATLVAAVRRGDGEAFALLHQRLRPLVFSAAFRITGDADVAEDVVQETFLQVHAALPAWRPEGQLTTWVYRIAVNEALDERRRARRRPRPAGLRPEPGPGAPAPSPTAAPGPLDPAAAERIAAAIAELPPRERTVFVLRHYEDLPLAEVAEVLGIALGTVKATLHHALLKLAERLKDLR